MIGIVGMNNQFRQKSGAREGSPNLFCIQVLTSKFNKSPRPFLSWTKGGWVWELLIPGYMIAIWHWPVTKYFFMKIRSWWVFLFFLLCTADVHAQQVNINIGYQSFYDQLSPYGAWVNYPGYGYVWKYRYSMNPSFKPYFTRGSWVYSEDGWAWVSDYPWGWAPFHYGRWFYDDNMGWLWIPGDQWAPAWVTWGSYEGDFCWAPIGPNISLTLIGGYHPPANYWVVCPGAYLGRPGWNTHVVNITQHFTMAKNISIINNNAGRSGSYQRGPEPQAVERFTKRPVRALAISENNKPGSDHLMNNKLAMYRPAVQQNGSTQAKPAPAHIESMSGIRAASKPRPGNSRTNRIAEPSRPVAKPVQPSSHRSNQSVQPPSHPVGHPIPSQERVHPPIHEPMSPAQHPVNRPPAPARIQPAPRPAQQPSRPPEERKH
jgi:hypothetical protein